MVDDDIIHKQNTDCVYFLASPLTCKKGSECEYRHSEPARLNPRDCYYWLAGNCINPNCSFRHPPLEGRSETQSEPVALAHPSSLPVNKINAPCYFYFSGFCNKGDKCSFMHSTNDVLPTPKVPKATPTANDPPSEKKTSPGNNSLPKVAESLSEYSKKGEAPSDPSRPKTLKQVINEHVQSKEDTKQLVHHDVVERIPAAQAYVSDREEEAPKSDSLLSAEVFVGTTSSSEQQSPKVHVEEEQVEREEWWESSPGLDVLVNNGSESYEDDEEYLPVHEGEVGRLHDHLLPYDYEDHVGFEPMEYPGVGVSYKDRLFDLYNGLEDDHMFDYVRREPQPPVIEKNFDPRIFSNRKSLPREREVNGRSGLDLRDHLRKRTRIDQHQPSHKRRTRAPSFVKGERQEQESPTHLMGQQNRPRLPSKVYHTFAGSEDRELNGRRNKNPMRQTQAHHNRSRPREKEKRRQFRPQFVRSEVVSRDRVPNGRTQNSTTTTTTIFSGPKTLAQIKEEKRKARGGGGESFGNTRSQSRKITTSRDFEGPKPLNEILKDKRKLGSVSNDDSRSRSRQYNHFLVEGSERKKHDSFGRDRTESIFDQEGEDFDDDDDLEKKLASIYS